MSEETTGNATGNGAQHTEQQAPATPETGSEKTVPYARFQQVNDAKKQAEATLQGVVDELMDDIPEDMREIVPDLPPGGQSEMDSGSQQERSLRRPAESQQSGQQTPWRETSGGLFEHDANGDALHGLQILEGKEHELDSY